MGFNIGLASSRAARRNRSHEDVKIQQAIPSDRYSSEVGRTGSVHLADSLRTFEAFGGWRYEVTSKPRRSPRISMLSIRGAQSSMTLCIGNLKDSNTQRPTDFLTAFHGVFGSLSLEGFCERRKAWPSSWFRKSFFTTPRLPFFGPAVPTEGSRPPKECDWL